MENKDFSIEINEEFRDSWVFDNPEYLRAWLVIIFRAKRENGGSVYNINSEYCKVGENSLTMNRWIQTLGKFWTRGKVYRFFKNLEEDGYIQVLRTGRSIKITILDYKFYVEL